MLTSKSSSVHALSRSNRRLVVSACSKGTSSGKFTEGARVKVTGYVKLFSVPKHPEGLEIEGMEGEVAKDVTQFKGKVLSATLPYLVKFKTDMAGADVKFQAHLAEDELQLVQ
ncbi:hypothetical protein CEUSTIGMA_g7435.t1 [Chlamydomonas eustigma]|uniref:Ferredoxin thioredoxin reductase alpha chain domain-containing protein n=1 Tax=Chlamydomonas eustigma TaxID=1157962 RepID=A0A250XA63_9CHLO|nr:hypothetical protein CEUSTIGMA_g7435.t1 [Chlamydomonas eustigma]|eukprot:GAX79995.1 hypothetical protein CEUSTIGMA_g7435.t1 [Chlamydomonas eustigma]